MGKKVEFRLHTNGKDATLSHIKGIKVGKSTRVLVPLRKVVHTHQNGRPILKGTVGWRFAHFTITIRLYGKGLVHGL